MGDEWAKSAAEEPDAHGMEWLSYLDRDEARAMPLPRSLAPLWREISGEGWVGARRWTGGRTSEAGCGMPGCRRPDGTVAGSTERPTSQIYQMKTGHCLSGQCLHWTKNRPTPQCWWCRYQTQTREHLFKVCLEWETQREILWEEVRNETGRRKSRRMIRHLLADERCSRAVLDFLTSTDLGRRVPAAEEDTVSEVSEAELWEWEEEQGAEVEGLGAGGGTTTVPSHA